MSNEKISAIATFAGGCFWCTEAVFKRLKGVSSVESGYAGGEKENPTYEEVSSGTTGYAESIQVMFDPKVISYEKLLDVFWATHDPTTLNRQGNDVGTQYRSVIFYHDATQKKEAIASKERLEKAGTYPSPVVTKIIPFTTFYPAGEDHKDYYDRNSTAPYCRVIIDPKVQKLLKKFGDEVKDEYR